MVDVMMGRQCDTKMASLKHTVKCVTNRCQTYEDAVKNAQELIEGYLAYCEESGLAIPTPNVL
jgi:predicted RNase H-like HicB family nuclease